MVARSTTRALAAALAVVATAAIASCGRRGEYDRSSPEATVRSLFRALAAGRIPADVGLLFADDREVARWTLWCEHHGCAGGTISRLRTEQRTGSTAVLRIDYEIYGRGKTLASRGTDAPVTLVRDGDAWRIVQFGERIVVRTDEPGTRPRPREADAAPPRDGGGAGVRGGR